jgi:hypothetical protein
MRRHAGDTPVFAAMQASACGALAILSDGNPLFLSAMLEAGAIDLAVAAMRRHAESEAVQDNGCMVLASVALDDDQAGGAVLDCAGCASVVLAAMRRFIDSWNVQSAGCSALGALAVADESSRAEVIAGDGLGAVLLAMRRHADSDAVQRSGCHVAPNLGVNDANRVAVVEAILAAMRRHQDSIDCCCSVASRGCSALVRLRPLLVTI